MLPKSLKSEATARVESETKLQAICVEAGHRIGLAQPAMRLRPWLLLNPENCRSFAKKSSVDSAKASVRDVMHYFHTSQSISTVVFCLAPASWAVSMQPYEVMLLIGSTTSNPEPPANSSSSSSSSTSTSSTSSNRAAQQQQ